MCWNALECVRKNFQHIRCGLTLLANALMHFELCYWNVSELYAKLTNVACKALSKKCGMSNLRLSCDCWCVQFLTGIKRRIPGHSTCDRDPSGMSESWGLLQALAML